MEPTTVFLEFSAAKLRQLAGRIKDATGRLTEEQIWARGSDNENAVGNLMLHLTGNVRQWIISGVGGKPDIRVRDREFSARGDISREELVTRLEATVAEAAEVLLAVSPAQLMERLQIQKYDVTVLEGIYHVVEHFAMHAGQIFFATKLFTGSDLGFYKHVAAGATPVEPQP